jgi:hypothetical protein
MLIADAGRAKGLGEERPLTELLLGSGERLREEGCWRMVKTKVLFRTRREH